MNTEKTNCLPLLEEAVRLLRAYQFQVAGDAATVETSGLDIAAHADTGALAAACDLMLVFGGDGTILRVAREVAGQPTPLLGINVGRLGFLAEVTAGQLGAAVDRIVAGDYRIEARPLMLAELKRGGPPLRAMNDFVFTRGDVSRMIEVEVAVDGEELTRYRCDGLIVASPTGSTAYSLAAGGAIVSPSARVFTITPICPLTLSNRSVIVDLNSKVLVRICTGKLKTHLTADGQVATRLRLGDETVIRKAPEEIRLLRLTGSSFFQTLQQKLHWSGSHA
ncbi:MAG: NAD(+)/NADH kinase [Verrucomicrobiales bacterium]|nr:NAD(+)/NADH kinase [Verrucomicrobiales bacterium]